MNNARIGYIIFELLACGLAFPFYVVFGIAFYKILKKRNDKK